MQPIAEVLENHIVLSLAVFLSFYLQFEVQQHGLLLVAICSNGSTRFEKLRIDEPLLNTPNTERKLRTIDILPCCLCEWLARLETRYSALEISAMFPFCISSGQYYAKNLFIFAKEAGILICKIAFRCRLISIRMDPISLL